MLRYTPFSDMTIPANKKRPQAVILMGIPASGKSTFSARCFGEAQGYVRINRDALRTDGAVKARLWQCLASRRSFVLDNTQVRRADRARFIALASAAGYEVCGYYMASSTEDCLCRNALRNGPARIPDAAIFSMAARLELPTYAEGFERIFHVSWEANGEYRLSPLAEHSAAPPEPLETMAPRMRKAEPEMVTAEMLRDAVALIVRLDGRSFSGLTNRLFEKPFDEHFMALMKKTVHHLMSCGFRVVSAYHQSDEISLMLYDGQECGRRPSKLLSLLAGEASAAFSAALGQPAAFDCRLHLVRSGAEARDYYRWRRADALRNAFNAYCYWTLRTDGLTPEAAHKHLLGSSRAEKNAMLAAHGIDFDTVPAWQKFGTLYVSAEQEHRGTNPCTGEDILYRRRIITDVDAAGTGV